MVRTTTHKQPRIKNPELIQCTYYLVPGQGDAFRDFCNETPSNGLRGAMVLFMACGKFPTLLQNAVNAVRSLELDAAITKIESNLFEAVTHIPFESLEHSPVRKVRRGRTHYTPRDTEQRSYFLPPQLADAFRVFWHQSPSDGVRGAIILFMACRQMPDLREEAIRVAQTLPVKQAIEKIERELPAAVTNAQIARHVQSMSQAERLKLLAQLRQK